MKRKQLGYPRRRLELLEKEFRRNVEELKYIMEHGGGMENIHLPETVRAINNGLALYCGYRGAIHDAEDELYPRKWPR